MIRVNENYLRLQGNYLFSTVAKKVAAYSAANPDKKLIRLGIGDVTQPLAEPFTDALHKAVNEMGKADTFRGYAPDLGYGFLREAIAAEYRARGCSVEADEIFISDGAKSDSGNIQEIFAPDTKVAVCDPVYPVYVDSNVMAGRSGAWDEKRQCYSDLIYMPCKEENGFMPDFPKEEPDLIYLCFPNNPTGMAATNIMQRELNVEMVNLGVSGEGKLVYPMARAMAEMDDVIAYIIDPVPNCTQMMCDTLTYDFIRIIRNARPRVPIIMVEGPMYPYAKFDSYFRDYLPAKNEAFRKNYERLKAEGDENLYYVTCEGLTGPDEEGTVDGIHLTDLGFRAYADKLEQVIREVVKEVK